MTFQVGDQVRVVGHDKNGFGHNFEVDEVGIVRWVDKEDGSLDVEVERAENSEGHLTQWVTESEVEHLDNFRLRDFMMVHADAPEMPYWVQRQDEVAVATLAEQHPDNIYYAQEV